MTEGFFKFDPTKHIIAEDALIAISDNEVVPFVELLKSHNLRRNILEMAKSRAFAVSKFGEGWPSKAYLAVDIEDLKSIIEDLTA